MMAVIVRYPCEFACSETNIVVRSRMELLRLSTQ